MIQLSGLFWAMEIKQRNCVRRRRPSEKGKGYAAEFGDARRRMEHIRGFVTSAPPGMGRKIGAVCLKQERC
jgi:hypothetical protein